MIEIKDLLLKFKNILLSGEVKRNIIRDVISETIGVEIKPEDVKIKNNTIYLNIKPIYKNEIFIKQDEILLKLQKSLSGKAPQSIR